MRKHISIIPLQEFVEECECRICKNRILVGLCECFRLGAVCIDGIGEKIFCPCFYSLIFLHLYLVVFRFALGRHVLLVLVHHCNETLLVDREVVVLVKSRQCLF